MSEVKKDDGLKLLNEYGDLHFLLHNFGIKIYYPPLTIKFIFNCYFKKTLLPAAAKCTVKR